MDLNYDNTIHRCSCSNLVHVSCVCKCQVEDKIKRAKENEVAKFTKKCIEHFDHLDRKLFDKDDIERELRYLCEQHYLKQQI